MTRGQAAGVALIVVLLGIYPIMHLTHYLSADPAMVEVVSCRDLPKQRYVCQGRWTDTGGNPVSGEVDTADEPQPGVVFDGWAAGGVATDDVSRWLVSPLVFAGLAAATGLGYLGYLRWRRSPRRAARRSPHQQGPHQQGPHQQGPYQSGPHQPDPHQQGPHQPDPPAG